MTFIPTAQGFISTNNSSTSTLTSSSTFTGTSDNVTDFATVSVSVITDQNSTDNGLSIQFSSDGTNWDLKYQYAVTGTRAVNYTLPVVSKFFRVVYTNGSTNQTYFRLQSILHNTKQRSSSTYDTSGALLDTQNVVLYSMNENKNIVPITSDSSNNALSTRISGPVTAFGEVLTGSLTPMATLTFPYNINTALVNTAVTGSGTITQSTIFANISTGTTTGSTARLRSNYLMKYVPNIGTNIKFTAIFSAPTANTTQYIGYGDSSNGFFLGFTGASFSINRRSNGSNNTVLQSSFNCDKLDGTGTSGMVYDYSKGNVFQIQFQWLGFGEIRFFIENPVTGSLIPFHKIRYSNANTDVSVRNPNGYAWMETSNGSTTTNVTLKCPSFSMSYEGNPNRIVGARFSISNEAVISSSTLQSVLSIRNKSTFQSVTNNVPVALSQFSFATEGNKSVRLVILLNATITGSSFTNISINQSVVDYSTNVVTVTGGQPIQTYYLNKIDSQVVNVFELGYELQPGDTITFACFTTSTTNQNSVAVSWIERF